MGQRDNLTATNGTSFELRPACQKFRPFLDTSVRSAVTNGRAWLGIPNKHRCGFAAMAAAKCHWCGPDGTCVFSAWLLRV